MVAELELTEITGLERQEDNREREGTHPQKDSSGSGATEDRETMVEYNKKKELDNEYVIGSEYKEMEETDEYKETMEYNEYGQSGKSGFAMRQMSSWYT
eukprot:2855349-Amphidinium_carterae.1